jgi:PAS domain S-box-containing protein
MTLQSVLDNIPDPIFCKDSEGRYVQINKSFAKLTGYSQAFIVNKTDYELYDKEDAEFFTKDDEKLLSSGLAHIVERKTIDITGKEVLFETRKTLIHYAGEDKAGILGISRDITDRKQFEGAMLNATRAAQEA